MKKNHGKKIKTQVYVSVHSHKKATYSKVNQHKYLAIPNPNRNLL